MFDRKSHWETIYSDKDPLQVSWYQLKPVLSLQFIKNSSVTLDTAFIDIGGGASELVDYLIEEGHTNISVLDISKKALEYAQNRLGKKANKISWYEEDITSFIAPHQFSVWYDRAVFSPFNKKSDRNEYVDVQKNHLFHKDMSSSLSLP